MINLLENSDPFPNYYDLAKEIYEFAIALGDTTHPNFEEGITDYSYAGSSYLDEMVIASIMMARAT